MTDSPDHRTLAGVEIVAHRAGNTVGDASAAAALARAGVIDMIEVDAHVFRGRVEARHAKVIRPSSRMWDGRTLLPADTARVPLEQVVRAIGPDVALMVDLKCFTTRAARRIRDVIPDDQPVVASTRSWWVLRAFVGRPRTRTLRSCGNRLQLLVARRLGWPWSSSGFAVHERRLTAPVVEELLTRADVVFAWGATTPARCGELRGLGVRGLIVDDLRLFAA